MKALAILALPFIVSASSPKEQCSAPVAVPKSVTTTNATYYSDAEPPKRFAHIPKGSITLKLGKRAIEEVCGKPTCGFDILACSYGSTIVLPNPYTTDAAEFAHLARHELAHINGWPDTHGD